MNIEQGLMIEEVMTIHQKSLFINHYSEINLSYLAQGQIKARIIKDILSLKKKSLHRKMEDFFRRCSWRTQHEKAS